MENVESLDEIPNLSGQVSLWSVRPVFNGAYSSVFHGKLGDQLVAVKVLKEIYGADVRTMQRKLKRERTTWGRLRHPNVLPLFGFADDHELFHPYGALVSPWRAEGNACEFLKSRGNEMSIFKRVNMWKGVVAGVAYLHNHTPVLVHGDLKSANVLIDNNHEPQICDFGLVSIFLEEGSSGMTTTSAHTGTDRYLAYELVLGGETAAPTMASDVFALGCIGLEFCFLQQPYAHRKNNMRGQIFIDIRAGVPPATRPAPSGSWNDALWAALDRCWEGHPSGRIGARDLHARLEEALHFEFLDPVSQNATQPRSSPGEPMDENSITDTNPAQLAGFRHAPVGSPPNPRISAPVPENKMIEIPTEFKQKIGLVMKESPRDEVNSAKQKREQVMGKPPEINENGQMDSGIFVWAKQDGHPWFPGVIFGPNDKAIPTHIHETKEWFCESAKLSPEERLTVQIVRFFDNTGTWAWLAPKSIRLLLDNEERDQLFLNARFRSVTLKGHVKQAYARAMKQKGYGPPPATSEGVQIASRTTEGDSTLRKGDIMAQPHMAYHASAVGGQFLTHLHAENSTASYVASTAHPAGTSYGSQYRAQDTTTDSNILVPIPDAPGFWGSGTVPEMGDMMAYQHPAMETAAAGPFTAEFTEPFGVPPVAHDSGTTSGEMRRTQPFQPLQNGPLLDRALDALSYLDSVKSQFHDHPEIYNRFLYIIGDFTKRTIDTKTLIEQVVQLFLGHPDLINGFNAFLPDGYRIEMGSQGSVVAHTPGGIIRIHSPQLTLQPDHHSIPSGFSFSPLSGHDFRLPLTSAPFRRIDPYIRQQTDTGTFRSAVSPGVANGVVSVDVNTTFAGATTLTPNVGTTWRAADPELEDRLDELWAMHGMG